jgi:hypothetical protein
MKSFREFIRESVTLRPTSYGTDRSYTNGQVRLGGGDDRTDKERLSTSFVHDGKRYRVILDPSYWSDAYDVVFTAQSMSDKTHMSVYAKGSAGLGALTVFSKVAFVAIDLAKKHGIDNLKFLGATDHLQKVYGKIMSSPSIADKLREVGWEAAIGGGGIFYLKKTHSS